MKRNHPSLYVSTAAEVQRAVEMIGAGLSQLQEYQS